MSALWLAWGLGAWYMFGFKVGGGTLNTVHSPIRIRVISYTLQPICYVAHLLQSDSNLVALLTVAGRIRHCVISISCHSLCPPCRMLSFRSGTYKSYERCPYLICLLKPNLSSDASCTALHHASPGSYRIRCSPTTWIKPSCTSGTTVTHRMLCTPIHIGSCLLPYLPFCNSLPHLPWLGIYPNYCSTTTDS